ncbi:kinase-like protein [Gymnopus androsaceus JB14]|uniref:Kinase-like protein n=1 Tax=Gymnopus androsaceus JB14 TaxID=1447944 RepID=A0A6A4HCD8_9AGAR|nr:kinase-like protein [Gymnopus androsaceus JB14]
MSKKDADLHLIQLRISDLDKSADDFEARDRCDQAGDALFLGGEEHRNGKTEGKGKRSGDEVAEAISPGGHVVKRRARGRPTAPNVVDFPKTAPQFRDRVSPSSSSSSSSEAGSPVSRRRVSGLHLPKPATRQRAPFTRVDSATLFFGDPAVASTPPVAVAPFSFSRRVTTSISSDTADSPFTVEPRSKMMNRHSYSGSGPVTPSSWRHTPNIVSPQSSPPPSYAGGDTESYDTEDDDSMIVDLPSNTSFLSRIPERSSRKSDQISKKYTSIGLSDEDEDMDFMESSTSSEGLSGMPRASSSVSSFYSDIEDGLVTPGVGARASSGWPDAFIVSDADYTAEQDVDAFILRTLAAAANGTHETKKAPGTPVKKTKVSYFAGQRPWQSAVAHKVGFGAHAEDKVKKVPRKSMPAVFPSLGRKDSKSFLDPTTDSESDYDESPSNRKDKYVGLGIGLPSLTKDAPGKRWLMRRSSSSAFSSGSDSMSIAGTPTRNNGLGDCLRPPGSPNISRQFSSERSASSSSNGSPSVLRKRPSIGDGQKSRAPRLSGRTRTRRSSQPTRQEQRSGRFENQFVELAQVGSGEFGKVLKVRVRDGNSECFAIKRSKRFEGAKHQLRLREEVETLQQLRDISGGQRHPNILAFIDAWEEDEQLFIWTELCEGGNFANFLWEYGRVFPRLDQARVWKIVAELSNPANIFLSRDARLKIGDFGMATRWPRPRPTSSSSSGSFEREGDKLYLAPEVLQGKYGKAADMFSFGMTILEAAANIVVPDQGEAWHRLRQEDFSQVDLEDSPQLLRLVQQMMRTNPSLRVGINGVYNHPIVARARAKMEQAHATAVRTGTSLFVASPLASVSEDFLPAILDNY